MFKKHSDWVVYSTTKDDSEIQIPTQTVMATQDPVLKARNESK
ncbi:MULTISPECIES: hypothetical protein [Lactococcus]|nr:MULTISPECIES: hypothetical protein [Lactococcus]